MAKLFSKSTMSSVKPRTKKLADYKAAMMTARAKPNTLPESYKPTESLDTFGLIPAPQFVKDFSKRQAEEQTRRAFANPQMDKLDRAATEAVMGSVGGPAGSVKGLAKPTAELLEAATRSASKFGEAAPTIQVFSSQAMKALGRGEEAARGVLIRGADSLHNFTRGSLERTAGGAIRDRQVKALQEVNDNLINAGHDPLNLPELTGRSVADVFTPGDIARNIEVLKSTHPEAYATFGLKTAKNASAHVLENDHNVGTSFVTWLINKRAKDTKDVLTRDWRDEQQALLDWANSGDNMQRVGRLYNQLKGSKPTGQAVNEMLSLEAEMASKGIRRPTQLSTEFMDFLSDSQKSLISTMGKGIVPEIKAGYNSASYAAQVAKNAAERFLK